MPMNEVSTSIPAQGVFDAIAREQEHEQVVFCRDKEAGLKAIIAVHSTMIGPALGGTRLWPYATEAEALKDVLRLSRGMTYKAALAGLNYGGGKSIIIADPKDKNELMLRRFGAFVHTLKGLYRAAIDVNMTFQDMESIHAETPYVLGLAGYSGDPSPFTAYGVLIGMKAAFKHLLGNEDLSTKKISIQGAAGHVGSSLVSFLEKEGATIYVNDTNKERLQALCKEYPKVKVLNDEELYTTQVDVFAPCALGGILNEQSIPKLKCQIVCGAANNQLMDEVRDAQRLVEQKILYVPDFAVNSGGLVNICVDLESEQYNKETVFNRIEKTYETVSRVLARATSSNQNTYEAALAVAEQRIQTLRKIYRPQGR